MEEESEELLWRTVHGQKQAADIYIYKASANGAPLRSFVIKIIRLMFRAVARKLSIYTYVTVSRRDIMTLPTLYP